MSAPVHGLLHALALDGTGGARPLEWEALSGVDSVADPHWIHLDRKHPEAQAWLRERSGLEPLVCDALLAEETRPRAQFHEQGAVVILRGVNLNPGATPDDMISVRMWVDANRVISLRSPRLLAIQDVKAELAEGRGPKTSGGVLRAIAGYLGARMMPVLANLAELLDGFEERILEDGASADLRRPLVSLRRQAITLRRYMGPQREAIAQLAQAAGEWFTERDRARLREIGDRATRDLEDLEAMRDRASVVQEELSNRIAEQMNRTMYLLSVITGIFLPLGFLTGLFGVNVGGMPGVESPWGFGILCGALAVLGGMVLWLMRRWRIL